MALEKVSGSSRRGTKAKISLRKSGSIGINSVALEEYFDEDDEFAEVWHDDETDELGIAGKKEETEDSYKITRSNSGGTVAPTSFLKAEDLIPEITTQYAPYTKQHGSIELVMIDLNDPMSTHGSRDTEEDELPEKTEITPEEAEQAGVEVETKQEAEQ